MENNIQPNPLPGGEVYTYDAVGNRLMGPNFGDTMSYDGGNELLDLNTTTYAYDLNGNMIQKTDGTNTTTYTYDDENRLTRVAITGGTNSVITYTYDPIGRRIGKNVDGTITIYVNDQGAIILEYDQTETVTARYTHGLNIDEPLSKEAGSQTYYYHGDGLGSIIVLTNASGNVVQTYVYDSFKNITNGLPTSQPFSYTAREYDTETGLYFYRARYYDPKIGRFLTQDPIGFADGVNKYAYVANNPVNSVDPLGLYICTYSIGQHRMVCTPNTLPHAPFDSSNYVSGNDNYNVKGPLKCGCKNNPDWAGLPNHGPIPPGDYSMGR